MTLIDVLEARARGEMRRSGRLGLRLVGSALTVASFLLLGILFYQAQFSGAVRWLLGFVLLTAVAFVAWLQVSSGTEEPAPLETPAARGRIRTGEMASLMSFVRRGNEGLPYSQLVVSCRARDAFAERARLALGLPPEAMRTVESDSVALRSRVHDEVLEDLLYLRTSEPDERYRWVREARARGGFGESMERVLDHMEAWR